MNKNWKHIVGVAGVIGLTFAIPLTASAQRTYGSGTSSFSNASSSQSLSNSGFSEPGRSSATTQLAIVDVDIAPEGAEIYVDGRSIGRAEKYMSGGETLKLAPGAHIIVIHHPEHRTVRGER